MSCFVPVCRMHVRFCVHHVCVCAHDDAFACGRVGVRVFETLQNVWSACVSPVRACVLYHGCVWAVRFKQRVHHIEN